MELADQLAALNAVLNGCSAACIVAGGLFVRRGDRLRHKRAMLGACVFSALFLCSYLARVALSGTHVYPADAPLRSLYLFILASHVVLAATVPVLVGVALFHALRDNVERHRKVVRFAYPIWLYVSATGVVVYLMLYHLAGV